MRRVVSASHCVLIANPVGPWATNLPQIERASAKVAGSRKAVAFLPCEAVLHGADYLFSKASPIEQRVVKELQARGVGAWTADSLDDDALVITLAVTTRLHGAAVETSAGSTEEKE